ncbi:MAG: hypothetical protein M1819_001508 [Sarea resinae]|nr:MAG: hypothetical protein M1819_001508 [Sarea resinae]
MVGKKSGKALLREEGLARTDNNLPLTSWPIVAPINQKNYYTEYLKRDDQILVYRNANEENRNRMMREAKDKDRALAAASRNEVPMADPDAEMADGNAAEDGSGAAAGQGSKVIIIHPGSQNLRIGLASDALPKTVPMVIARKAKFNESELASADPKPKRVRKEGNQHMDPEQQFGEEFATQFTAMTAEMKTSMRSQKFRVLPNSKELVVNYNRRHTYDTVSEHNDSFQINWTDIPPNPKEAPEVITGHEALRIPDDSRPRYKLSWPIQHGWCNEEVYTSKTLLYEDISVIIEDAIKNQLGLKRKKDWTQYGCVFIIPDLYERSYVTSILEMLFREFSFGRVCFIQESVAATFGAGYSTACIVDMGAQKTSICCVDEGMCLENSRVNLKYGGADVTDTFIRMMLFDQFPYADINLKRRYDFLLAEELKQLCCHMIEGDIGVHQHEFHLRVAGQDTRKYTFKVYDEVILAPMGYFKPSIFDNSEKLRGRRKIIERSYDLYDKSPNDPVSSAQTAICREIAPSLVRNDAAPDTDGISGNFVASTPSKQPPGLASRLNDLDNTPRSSVAGSPAPEGNGTPQPAGTTTPAVNGTAAAAANAVAAEKLLSAEERDRILPVYPLDQAILMAISNGSRDDERKTRDFLGGIMVIGGGSQLTGFRAYLEARLRELRPRFDIMIGTPPRELDAQVVVWKGGSVFGKLKGHDSWIQPLEYDRLGSRSLAYKCMWAW